MAPHPPSNSRKKSRAEALPLSALPASSSQRLLKAFHGSRTLSRYGLQHASNVSSGVCISITAVAGILFAFGLDQFHQLIGQLVCQLIALIVCLAHLLSFVLLFTMECSVPEPRRMATIHGILDRSGGSSVAGCLGVGFVLGCIGQVGRGQLELTHELPDSLGAFSFPLFGSLGGLHSSLGGKQGIQSRVQFGLNSSINSIQLILKGLRGHNISFTEGRKTKRRELLPRQPEQWRRDSLGKWFLDSSWNVLCQNWKEWQALLEKSTGLVSLSHEPDQHPGDRWLFGRGLPPTILHR